MTIFIVILVAIIFYYIGKYSQTTAEQELVVKVKKKLKNRPPAGVIPFKTQEDFDDERSGDKALEKRWIESGFAKLVKDDNKVL